MRRIVCVILVSLTLTSCGNKAGKNDRFSWVDDARRDKNESVMSVISHDPIIVDVQHGIHADCMLLSDYAKSVDLIPLESSSGSPLIGSIDKIIRQGDRLFLLDRRKSASIHVYSSDGRYVNSIGSHGQGPGEYVEPTDFDVRGDSVIILDQYSTRLLFYSSGGEYIGSKKMPFYATGISVMSDTVYLFNSINADNKHLGESINYYLYATDSALTIKSKGYHEEHGKYISLWIPGNFYRNGNNTHFHPPLSDNIFAINADCEIKNTYRVDFGDKALPEKYRLDSNWDEFKDEAVQSAYYIFPGRCCDVGNYLCLEFLNHHETKILMFDKETNRVTVARGMKNDIGMQLPIGNLIGCDSSRIYTCITPDILIKADESAREDKRESIFTKEGRDFIHSLGKEDNPIVFSILLK